MVMPLYDDNPFALPHRPVVTWCLILANVIVFLVEFAGDMDVMVFHFGVVPAAMAGEVVVPGGLPPILTLFSYMFLHADVLHILGNLTFLWVFGDNVEEALGRFRFLVFYLSCGVLGALAFVASNPQSETPLVGASAAIAGVVIAYAMHRPCAKITALVFGIPLRIRAFWIIGLFVVMQFISLGSSSKSEVAYWAHVGGMIAGAALFPLMKRAGVVLFECMRAPKRPVAVVEADPGVGPPGWPPR
jgi:membrane associated rhomboid family serine protease